MASALDSLRQTGAVLGFGELLLRLSGPAEEKLLHSPQLKAVVGGAEANVVVGLSCLGHQTRMLSAVPTNSLGDAAKRFLRMHGVDDQSVVSRSGRMGLYFLEPGAGPRAAEVIYDRAGSVFAEADASTFGWDAALENAAILHVSGVTPALGEKSVAQLRAGLELASQRGITISFDGNFRASLWARWNPNPGPVLFELMSYADILFANHRDMSLVLNRSFGSEGSARRKAAAQSAFDMFPRLKLMASTARHLDSADQQRLSARIDTRTMSAESVEIKLSGIVDRIGTGDAFVVGVLHALRTFDRPYATEDLLKECVECGIAVAALKHTIAGDASVIGLNDLAAYRQGLRDVRR
jgi:2-dehydro-3-deoxygluconokinase